MTSTLSSSKVMPTWKYQAYPGTLERMLLKRTLIKSAAIVATVTARIVFGGACVTASVRLRMPSRTHSELCPTNKEITNAPRIVT